MIMFAKLQNGKYGLRAWYPNLKTPKKASEESDDAEDASETQEEGDKASVV